MQPNSRKLTPLELVELFQALDKQTDKELIDAQFDVDLERVEVEGGVETNFLDGIA